MDDMLKEKIIKILPKLKNWQRKVIAMRLGLMGEQPHSIDEIAKQLGYKEKTVDEIIASVLRKTKDNPDSIKELGADEVLGRMEYGRRIRVINREHFLPKRENDEK